MFGASFVRLEGLRLTLVPRSKLLQLREEDAKRLVEAGVKEHGEAFLAALVGRGRLEGADDAELRRRAVEILATGALLAVYVYEPPRLMDPPKVRNLADLADAPSAREDPRDWIALRVRDIDGRPVVDEPYVIELADGSEVEGRTDADGFARHDGVVRGKCRISFPNAGEAIVSLDEREKLEQALGAEPALEAAQGATDPNDGHQTVSDLILPPEQPSPPGTTWIVIEVEDDEGMPLAEEPFELMLPSGERTRGKLDDGGRVELTGIEVEGLCVFRLSSRSGSGAPDKFATGCAHRLGLPAG